MSVRVWRYEVPVDDQWHPITLTGRILHVGCRSPWTVEFWATHVDGPHVVEWTSEFIVVGTNHPWPDHANWVGTVVAPGDRLVWHLLERHPIVGKDD